MHTRIETIDPACPDLRVISEAGRILREGGLVAFPTETVYGLGGDALNPEASDKIYGAKGRPSDNPLIVHIADREALGGIVREIPPKALALADAFWPGPLTMIFGKNGRVPLNTTGGLDTVAVRMPSHPAARELIRRSTGYIAAPSANVSGRPSPTKAIHVIEDLRGRVEMILDGGPVGIGLESTIVDFSERIPTVLRPGYISVEMLEEVIGTARVDRGLMAEDSSARPKAPGMKYRHYAPRAELVIVEGEESRVVEAVNGWIQEKESRNMHCGVIATDETAPLYRVGAVVSMGPRGDEEELARHLFDVLRRFDSMDVACIYSESFYTPRMGQAIMNRLLKAAGHRVVQV
jgi:L-threonylcarbamoyladenylate synthase